MAVYFFWEGGIGQLFCEVISNLSEVFIMIKIQLCVWGKKHEYLALPKWIGFESFMISEMSDWEKIVYLSAFKMVGHNPYGVVWLNMRLQEIKQH